MIVVNSPLNKNLQLVDADKPINPNRKVIKEIQSTILNGCICNDLIVKS
ncbi:MAG: hypothetical protein AB6733_12835 [Clostridiaceae bacterium]